MSYQAIARKWRPTGFEEIAGQGHVTRTLRNAIGSGRVHHAYLFSGPRGVGKTTVARVLARALRCEKGPTADPCGECPNCKDVLAGSSPDVIEIDGASNNSVEDVRALREAVRYLPQRGRYKVYIVDEVHMLSRGAFNALLKTLEEPPDHVVFLFATTEPHKVPDTILSRVQRFDLKRIPSPVVTDRLRKVCEAEGVRIPDDALRMLARAGEGSMRDSQSLLDQVISFGGTELASDQVAGILGLVDRRLLHEMVDGILRGDAGRCLAAVGEVYDAGFDLAQFTSELLDVLHAAAMVALSPSSKPDLDLSADEVAWLEAAVQGVAPEVLVRAFDVVIETHEQVARAPHPRLVLDMATARLVAIRPARPLDGLLERLVDLERRVRSGSSSTGPSRSASPAPRPQPPRAPSPPPARETAAPAPDPDLPADPGPAASPDDRWRVLCAWLETGGIAWDVWARESVLLSAAPPVLRVGFSGEFVANKAARQAADPRLLRGVAHLFPGCRRVETAVRPTGGATRSAREDDRDADEARLVALRREMEGHPVVKKVQAGLGGEIEDVRPDES